MLWESHQATPRRSLGAGHIATRERHSIDRFGKLHLAGEEADIDDLMRRLRWLVGKVTADRWCAATVLPQLHVLAWGSKRGV
jgi:hypothetical protein